jgi:hypothetical protein
MDVTQLLDPVLANGIRSTNFFNGRVLTADDLRTEQRAGRDRLRHVGRALGEGVAHGLEVSRRDPVDGVPVLHVRPGAAFSRDGDAAVLGRPVDVRLVHRHQDVPPESGLFAVCQPRHVPLELTNVGLYVLTVSPASGLSEERAPMVEVGAEGIASGCASRWALEGVRFSVAPLPLAAAGAEPSPLAEQLATLVTGIDTDVDLVLAGGASDTPAVRTRLAERLSRLRNGAAYLCFGVEERRRHAALPPSLSPASELRYGAVDGMRERGELESCEVPVALFHLSKRGVEWVDRWAVRRPPVPAVSSGVPAVPGARVAAEGMAMLLQFQQHAEALLRPGGPVPPGSLRATRFFRFLPPAGVLPTAGGAAQPGFTRDAFFHGRTLNGPTFLEGARMPSLLRDAAGYAPTDLADQEMIWLYHVRENTQAAASAATPRYLLFTNGHVPYRGFAQMDVSRWDYSNYA